jgi:hypothetical protein
MMVVFGDHVSVGHDLQFLEYKIKKSLDLYLDHDGGQSVLTIMGELVLNYSEIINL